LNITPTVQQVEHNREQTIEDISEEGETIEKTSEPLSTNINIDPILIREWEQFDQQIKSQSDPQNIIASPSPTTK